jgi:hypothetical protein
MRGAFFAFTAAATIFLTTSASAATFSTSLDGDRNVIVTLTGQIVEGDSDELASIVRRADDRGNTVVMLQLNSPGGRIVEGVKLADIVRDEKIATSVVGSARCASACFMVFAAGSKKIVSTTARVGVHGASDEHGKETPQSSVATLSMARISKELGVPPSIIGKMVVTPPNEIVWLTPDDLRSMGATIIREQTRVSSGPSSDPQLSSRFPQPNQSSANQPDAPTWENLIDRAMELSTKQKGRPDFKRVCQPELQQCTDGLSFRSPDGTDMVMNVTENMDGKTLRREICSFNKTGDVRTCVDFDTGAQRRDMRHKNGTWYNVGDSSDN